jgi:TP901 family phage tail tape measure protein
MGAERAATFVLRLRDLVSGPLEKLSKLGTQVIDKFEGMGNAATRFGKTALFLTSLTTAIETTANALNTAVAPGESFQASLAEMQAITGVTNDELQLLGENARKTARMFGGDAAAQVESYQVILSKLGPELAKSPQAMDQMGKSVQLMSKTMKGDAVGAVEALTTAMNQYNVDLSDPIKASQSMARMMDIMTNGAKVGSAEVPQIAESIKVAGLTAKNAGLNFEELNTAIQIMGKGSVYGAEAGTALRNVLSIMDRGRFLPPSTQEELAAAGVDVNRLADKTLSFADRMKELNKISHDSALVTKMFGMENKNAAMLLMQQMPLYETYLAQIGEQGSTMQMASTIMDTHQEKMKRIMATIKDYGISVFNATESALPFIQTLVMTIAFASQLAPGLALINGGLALMIGRLRLAAVAGWAHVRSMAASVAGAAMMAGQFILTSAGAIGSFIVSIGTATLSMIGLNIAMYANPIGLIILGLLAVGAAVTAVIVWWDELKYYLLDAAIFIMKLNPFYWLIELVEYVFPGTKQAIADFFGKVWEWASAFFEKLVAAWKWVKGWFTSEDLNAELQSEVQVGTDITFDPNSPDPNSPSGNFADVGLNNINTADRSTNIQGDSGKARNVNMRIDKIEVNVKVADSNGRSLTDIADEIAQVIVGAARDAETILSNG